MKLIKSHIKLVQTFVLMLLCGACLLPKPPSTDILKTLSKNITFDSYRVVPQDITRLRGERRPWRSAPDAPQRNLLFVAVDETVQVQFQERLRELYQSEQQVRLEDVSWWRFVPKMRGLYDQVIRIPHDQLSAQSLEEAIIALEEVGKPYDVMLLTHGIPNHVTASQGQDFISYKTIQNLPELKNLRLVFMQGCFSETLAQDWLLQGAQEVLSYEGWNRNFFYIDFFLPALKKHQSVQAAYEEVNRTIKEDMGRSLFYQKILEEMELDLEGYFDIAPPPIYDRRS